MKFDERLYLVAEVCVRASRFTRGTLAKALKPYVAKQRVEKVSVKSFKRRWPGDSKRFMITALVRGGSLTYTYDGLRRRRIAVERAITMIVRNLDKVG